MSKRRRDEVDGYNEDTANPYHAELPNALSWQKEQLTRALDDGKKQLFHALRLARGSERQKLGRRAKNALSKDGGGDSKGGGKGADAATAERIEIEVAALKSLDLTAAAEIHLCRHLVKARAVAASQALPAEVLTKAAEPVSKNVAYANVTARLYKSNPVVEAVEKVMDKVRRVLGLSQDEAKPMKKKRMRKADYEAAAKAEVTGKDEEEMRAERPDGDGAQGDKDFATEQGSFDGLVDKEPMLEDGIKGDSDGQSTDCAQFDARLASGSESEGEDGIKMPTPGHDDMESRAYPTAGHQRSLASVSLSSYSQSPSPPPTRKSTTSKPLAVDRTAFLPSLAAGYISGSESEASDVSGLAAPRKNRMGQRARQALWERKYGANARHVKAGKGGAAAATGDRDRGWDRRRGATGNDDHGGRWTRGGRRADRRGGRPRGGRGVAGDDGNANHTPLGREARISKDKVPTYGAEHPSWIAKQKAKQMASATAKPAGKKITFD